MPPDPRADGLRQHEPGDFFRNPAVIGEARNRSRLKQLSGHTFCKRTSNEIVVYQRSRRESNMRSGRDRVSLAVFAFRLWTHSEARLSAENKQEEVENVFLGWVEVVVYNEVSGASLEIDSFDQSGIWCGARFIAFRNGNVSSSQWTLEPAVRPARFIGSLHNGKFSAFYRNTPLRSLTDRESLLGGRTKHPEPPFLCKNPTQGWSARSIRGDCWFAERFWHFDELISARLPRWSLIRWWWEKKDGARFYKPVVDVFWQSWGRRENFFLN